MTTKPAFEQLMEKVEKLDGASLNVHSVPGPSGSVHLTVRLSDKVSFTSIADNRNTAAEGILGQL